MKTIMIYDQCGVAPIQFFILDGDYSHLDNIFINEAADNTDLQDELGSLVYDDNGKTKLKVYKKFPLKTAAKPGTKVIVAGFYP